MSDDSDTPKDREPEPQAGEPSATQATGSEPGPRPSPVAGEGSEPDTAAEAPGERAAEPAPAEVGAPAAASAAPPPSGRRGVFVPTGSRSWSPSSSSAGSGSRSATGPPTTTTRTRATPRAHRSSPIAVPFGNRPVTTFPTAGASRTATGTTGTTGADARRRRPRSSACPSRTPTTAVAPSRRAYGPGATADAGVKTGDVITKIDDTARPGRRRSRKRRSQSRSRRRGHGHVHATARRRN